MNLRDQIIEAAADELERLADLRVGVGMKFAAESVLNAMLDVLTRSDLEWKREAARWWSEQPEGTKATLHDLSGLVAVLRDSVGVEVDQ